jgi:hypothetical protein
MNDAEFAFGSMQRPKFIRPTPQQQKVLPLGRIVATADVLTAVPVDRITECLVAHTCADWGCVSEADRRANDEALRCGFRVLSAYAIDPSQPCRGYGENTVWIITEWDRSLTTVLLPKEY